MLRSTPLLAVVLAVACGDNSNNHNGTDAPTGDGNSGMDTLPIDGAPASSVLVTTFSPPDFIAFRTGNGPWQTPTADSNGDYPITVSDDYLVLVVCDDAGSGSAFDAEEFGFTFSGDGATVSVFCNEPSPGATASGSGSNVRVTGTMVQAGSVQVGGVASQSATAAWAYSATVPTGPHDVLAIDTANNAVFDHAIDFEGSAAIGPAIDTGSGAALDVQPLVVTNLGSGQVFSESAVSSTDLSVLAQGSADNVVGLPASELAADDFQFFDLVTLGATTEQLAEAFEIGPVTLPATYAMLGDFTTASFKVAATGASGSWTTLPASTFDSVGFFIGNNEQTQSQQISASASYLTARALTTLEFDDSAPGYLAAWKIDPQMGFVDLSQNFDDPTTGLFYNTVAFPASPLRAEHRRPRPRHARGASRRIVP